MNRLSEATGFIACDWGTSALRLHIVGADGNAPLGSVSNGEGIGTVYRAWQAAGTGVTTREVFYLQVIRRGIEQLATDTGRSFEGLPLVISGMASATIGLLEVPYTKLPFQLDGTDLRVATIPAAADFSHECLLVSGARVSDDIMRGEETQLVGAAALEPVATAEGLVILPGTHSKHVQVSDGRVVSLRTYMTGEFFELLACHSILANSVDGGGDCPAEVARTAFAEGVLHGAKENLLHAGFGVRVAEISGRRDRAAGHHYLSGLVIGAELADLPTSSVPAVTLVGSSGLTARYRDALGLLGCVLPVTVVSGESAVIAGQRRILAQARAR